MLTPETAAMESYGAGGPDAPTDRLKLSDLKNADYGADGISGSTAATTRAGRIPAKVVDFNGEAHLDHHLAQERPVPGDEPDRGGTRAQRSGGLGGPERAAPAALLVGFGSTFGPADAAGHVQQQLPDRADQGRGADRVEMVHDVRMVRLNAKRPASIRSGWAIPSAGGRATPWSSRPSTARAGPARTGREYKVTSGSPASAQKQIKYRFKMEDPGSAGIVGDGAEHQQGRTLRIRLP